jgi:hypothetical protein
MHVFGIIRGFSYFSCVNKLKSKLLVKLDLFVRLRTCYQLKNTSSIITQAGSPLPLCHWGSFVRGRATILNTR